MKTSAPRVMIALSLILALALTAGCSLFKSDSDSAATASGDRPKQGTLGRYYDFDDIQVPVQLKLNKEQSTIFRVGSFKAGVLVFSDNVELESLINFFIESMAKDNWSLKGSFKYPKAALLFAKPGKTCVIQITESWLKTTVELWVAPTSDGQ
ncbi:Lipoprotein [Desulfarculales bacterium]